MEEAEGDCLSSETNFRRKCPGRAFHLRRKGFNISLGCFPHTVMAGTARRGMEKELPLQLTGPAGPGAPLDGKKGCSKKPLKQEAGMAEQAFLGQQARGSRESAAVPRLRDLLAGRG